MRTGADRDWREVVKVGFRSGYLEVIGKPERPPSAFLVRCDCGKVFAAHPYLINTLLSCGCMKKLTCGVHSRKHGGIGTRTYSTWRSMVQRCTSENDPSWHRYGGRGIQVCDRWLNFENFREDMGVRPANKTLDRIDNTGNYEPENCRWATLQQQQNNRACTLFLTHDGETLPIMEWARSSGLGDAVIRQRIRLGWSESDAVSIPKEPRKPRNVS